MAYRCIMNQGNECIGCEECKEKPMYYCDQCNAPIYEGDFYYYIDDEIYCEDCVKDIFGVYA